MSDTCNCIDIKVEVMMDEPKIKGEVDVTEVILCSDGEDYKRGYEEGHEKGYADGKKDGITEGYNNGYEQGKTDGYSDGYKKGFETGYSEGYEKGKTESGADSYYDTFWDGWTNFGARSPAAAYLFKNWTDEMFYPKYDYAPTSLQNTFASSTMNIDLSQRFKDCGVKLDTSKSLYMSGAFTNSHFTKIPFISFEKSVLAQALNAFNGCKKLVVLEGIKVLKEHKYDALFGGCSALTTIERIEGEIGDSISFSNSPSLDDLTVDNIVNAYADMTGQTAPVLTFHADVKARVVADDEKDDTDPTKHYWLKTLTSKNVTLA